MSEIWAVVIAGALTAATPLILAALGEAFLQRSGAGMNLGIEGVLLCAALAAVAGSSIAGPWAGVGLGLIVGVIFGAIYAAGSVIGIDTVVVGIGTLMLGEGLSTFLHQVHATGGTNLHGPTIPALTTPSLGAVSIAVFLTAGLIAVSWWILKHTRFGLRLRACGDDAEVAVRRGISVRRYRALAALISGGLSGVAGAVAALATIGAFTPHMTAGKGFVALAVVLISRGTPLGILGSGLLFAVIESLALLAQTRGLGLAVEVYRALSWVIPIVVLCLHAQRRHHRLHQARR
ncbi:hypothetical protein DL991_10705 [Amycolatopsis sp. WAC 01375]|uniref:ABC transporter permease n=1 Tax=Amycolatopsis sp. WAC 01375 TaxID=2203194 RepID=UPI000F7B3BCC|nr:ABC transporter permease [Amycolatopsis sp. WAC 01375]RSM80572.1 hypothetical protein DL991_10705 [Amycolatopsis sp. WAC 01375]